MAKKKEEQLSYLQMPLPKGQKKTRTVKVNWSGLNYRQTLDTGSLSKEKNISVSEAPYLTPSGTFEEFLDFGNGYDYGLNRKENEGTENEGTENEKIWKNAEYLYGVKGLLYIAIYKNVFWSNGDEQVKACVSVADNNRIIDFAEYGSEADLNTGINLEDIIQFNFKCANFSTYVGENIASTNKSDIVDTMLFFPYNKSLEYTVVEDIKYRTSIKNTHISDIPGMLEALYPWAFVEDFVDKKKVYNVTKGVQVPILTDLRYRGAYENEKYTFSAYDVEPYVITNDRALNESWILGQWFYDSKKNKWMPLGYNADVKKKEYAIAGKIKEFDTSGNPCPTFKDVTVFQSRLFGIDDGKVYASEFNNYCGWSLDTADSSLSSNAWITVMNANTKASGPLTAITAYQDRVVVFRENAMYEIRNTKNPFRVVDIFQEGCIGREALAIVNGILFFVSRNGIKMYTGSRPKDIGYELGFNQIDYAVAGGYNNVLYVYCETDVKTNNLFSYDTTTGVWSEIEIGSRVKCFTENDSGFYMLCNNKVYRLNEDVYSDDWMAETDFYTGRTVDIKHLQKIQMLAEMAPQSKFEVYVLYDNEQFDDLTEEERAKRCVCKKQNEGEKVINQLVRVIPRKNANYGFKIRIQGSGYVKLYQMELTMTGGGELFNE